MNTQPTFYNAIAINNEKCIACSHCVRVCPTEALRVWNGTAQINENRCIDCGECYNVCPVEAIYVKDDSQQFEQSKAIKAILVPSVFYGQFPKSYSHEEITENIKKIGFEYVFEVENSVEYLSNEIDQYIKENDEEKHISSFCPAVIRLIQLRYPEWLPSIVPIKSPVDISALHFRHELEEKHPSKNIEIYYVTPCPAKSAFFHFQAEKGEELPVTGSLNMDKVYNWVSAHLQKDDAENHLKSKSISGKSVLWSLPGGEIKHMVADCLSVHGTHNIKELLDSIDGEEFSPVEFIELKACYQGCAGGILTVANKFVCVDRLKHRAHNAEITDLPLIRLEEGEINTPPIEPNRDYTMGKNPLEALRTLNKARQAMCHLPGFDCGACGAPSCTALAEDIAKGTAILSHCVFMQRELEKKHQLSSENAFHIIESVWGKDRLKKDCNKKGAINDRS